MQKQTQTLKPEYVWTVTFVRRSAVPYDLPETRVFVHESDARTLFFEITKDEETEATEFDHETGNLTCFHAGGSITKMERHIPKEA